MVMTAFIFPYTEDREMVRELVEEGEFIEAYPSALLSPGIDSFR